MTYGPGKTLPPALTDPVVVDGPGRRRLAGQAVSGHSKWSEIKRAKGVPERLPPVANSKRNGWTDPDRRRRDSARQTGVWAAMSPEARAERVARAAEASKRARGLVPA